MWDGGRTWEVLMGFVLRKISQTILKRCPPDRFTCQNNGHGFFVARSSYILMLICLENPIFFIDVSLRMQRP